MPSGLVYILSLALSGMMPHAAKFHCPMTGQRNQSACCCRHDSASCAPDDSAFYGADACQAGTCKRTSDRTNHSALNPSNCCNVTIDGVTPTYVSDSSSQGQTKVNHQAAFHAAAWTPSAVFAACDARFTAIAARQSLRDRTGGQTPIYVVHCALLN